MVVSAQFKVDSCSVRESQLKHVSETSLPGDADKSEQLKRNSFCNCAF